MPEAARKVEAPEPEKPPEKTADVLPVARKNVVIKLEKSVQAHGETLDKITFRLPTGGDVMAMDGGYPVNINWQTGAVTPNSPVMGQMMSLLAEVPPSTIKSLTAQDFSTCAHALMGFFTPGSQAMQF